MGIRDKIKRLERAAEGEIATLVCQECGQEFVVREGVELDLIADDCAEGAKERGHKVYGETPADALALVNHEHSELSLINKRTGERLFPWERIHEE